MDETLSGGSSTSSGGGAEQSTSGCATGAMSAAPSLLGVVEVDPSGTTPPRLRRSARSAAREAMMGAAPGAAAAAAGGKGNTADGGGVSFPFPSEELPYGATFELCGRTFVNRPLTYGRAEYVHGALGGRRALTLESTGLLRSYYTQNYDSASTTRSSRSSTTLGSTHTMAADGARLSHRLIVEYPVHDYKGAAGRYCGPKGSPAWDDDVHYGAPVSLKEESRLEALSSLKIWETPADPTLDDISREATATFRVPMAVVCLVGKDKQWFKSKVGLQGTYETPRNLSFCAHLMLEDSPMALVVRDSLKDRRFCYNPVVTGPPFIRFYAAYAIILPGGTRVGTFCVLDNRPRPGWTVADSRRLEDMALRVTALIAKGASTTTSLRL